MLWRGYGCAGVEWRSLFTERHRSNLAGANPCVSPAQPKENSRSGFSAGRVIFFGLATPAAETPDAFINRLIITMALARAPSGPLHSKSGNESPEPASRPGQYSPLPRDGEDIHWPEIDENFTMASVPPSSHNVIKIANNTKAINSLRLNWQIHNFKAILSFANYWLAS